MTEDLAVILGTTPETLVVAIWILAWTTMAAVAVEASVGDPRLRVTIEEVRMFNSSWQDGTPVPRVDAERIKKVVARAKLETDNGQASGTDRPSTAEEKAQSRPGPSTDQARSDAGTDGSAGGSVGAETGGHDGPAEEGGDARTTQPGGVGARCREICDLISNSDLSWEDLEYLRCHVEMEQGLIEWEEQKIEDALKRLEEEGISIQDLVKYAERP